MSFPNLGDWLNKLFEEAERKQYETTDTYGEGDEYESQLVLGPRE